MKILGENKLILTEDNAGEAYEKEAVDYLNKKYGAELPGIVFAHMGGNDNSKPDIAVQNDGKTLFYIECKDLPAQAGEFALRVDGDKLTFIPDVNPSEEEGGRDTQADVKCKQDIVDYLNKNFADEIIGDYQKTGTVNLRLKDSEIIDLMKERIKVHYAHMNATWFCAPSQGDKYSFVLVNELDHLMNVSAVTVRNKANNSKFTSNETYATFSEFAKENGFTDLARTKYGKGNVVTFNSSEDLGLKNAKQNKLVDIGDSTYAITINTHKDVLPGDYILRNANKGTIKVIAALGKAKNGIDDELNLIKHIKDELNEGLGMNKNLSEELIINDNISLGKNDEEQAKEIEKSAEEHEKEVNKELADKVKDVEEINEFEVKPIKGLSEKLTLEEPSDVLTEDFEDELNDDIFILADNITNLLKSFMRTHPEVPDRDGIFEDAFNIAMNNILKVNEEVLDEKIPADLAKAYKQANYTGRSGANTDLQNADYQEVDANTGYKLYKEDPKQVRLLVNGKLIDFRDNGYPSLNHRDEWLPDNLAYVKKNGQKIKDTLHVPAKHLFNIASKIYVTNEHKPEGQKDPDLLSQRRENPESRYGSVSDLKSRGVASKYWGDPEIRGNVDLMNSSSYRRQRVDRYKKELKQYQEYIKNATSDSDKRYYQQRIDKLNDSIKELQGDINDAEARKRYANSERSLQKPLERYISLKNNINNLQDRVDRSQRELEQVRTNGSDESRRNKQRLTELQQRLKELRKQIAMVELDLEGTDEEDARAVAAAEAKYQAAMGQLGDAQAEINALLRRG